MLSSFMLLGWQVRTSSMGSFGNWSATHLRKPLSPNFCAGGMFWTSRDRILFNSKRFYEGLLQQLTDHPQPEVRWLPTRQHQMRLPKD